MGPNMHDEFACYGDGCGTAALSFCLLVVLEFFGASEGQDE